jgi:hypothetical protein
VPVLTADTVTTTPKGEHDMRSFTCDHEGRHGTTCGRPAFEVYLRDGLDAALGAIRDPDSKRWHRPMFRCAFVRHQMAGSIRLTGDLRDVLDRAYADREAAQAQRRREAEAREDAERMTPEGTFVVEQRTRGEDTTLFVVVRQGGTDYRSTYEVRVEHPRDPSSWARAQGLASDRPRIPAAISWSSNWNATGPRSGPGANEALAMAQALTLAARLADRLNHDAGVPFGLIEAPFVDRTDVAYSDLMAALA